MEYRRRNLWNDAVEEHVSYQLTGEMSSGGWLWNTFKTNDWIVELTTLTGNFQGYLFSFNSTQLNDILSEAIQNREPEIIMCMERKL